jgi:hypothetical protein
MQESNQSVDQIGRKREKAFNHFNDLRLFNFQLAESSAADLFYNNSQYRTIQPDYLHSQTPSPRTARPSRKHNTASGCGVNLIDFHGMAFGVLQLQAENDEEISAHNNSHRDTFHCRMSD